MLSNLMVDQIILDLLKKKLWCLDNILTGNFGFPRGYRESVVKLFFYSYNFLSLFCLFNPENQSKLHSNISLFF